jgi:hypothetical protein
LTFLDNVVYFILDKGANMTKYFSNIEEALNFVDELKAQEPAYAEKVLISETDYEYFGIWAREDLGDYVVSNETA